MNLISKFLFNGKIGIIVLLVGVTARLVGLPVGWHVPWFWQVLAVLVVLLIIGSLYAAWELQRTNPVDEEEIVDMRLFTIPAILTGVWMLFAYQ